MLLLNDDAVAVRRDAARGPLAPLAESLAADLAPVLGATIELPAEKARLSKLGGRCPSDGAALAFDPWSPRAHRCPACGAEYRDEAHYRWWIMGYQLWLAERAVHGALLHLLRGEEVHADLAERILEQYAERYLHYPNRDNVLGPTRLFFSTYLESIWLLQITIALDLLEGAGRAATLGSRVRDRIVEPSRRIIAVFDEGLSNRQAWNAPALLAAARMLGDGAAAERATRDVARLLDQALLPDGTWYEGENYHLFAHRGLWYGVMLATQAGVQLPEGLLHRFDEGFAAPFLTALPDLTLPSRRDSQYAISLRQWRFAELAELGLVRRHDPRLLGALHDLYFEGPARRDTGRATSTAEVERNLPPSALGRADLGWRSLLLANPVLPTLEAVGARSLLLESQGLALFRRDGGRLWVALDYGHSGGGHGHPDRLQLLIADGDARWLDDPGTGSYVERTLFWYRSTLAHGAPLVDGRSQWRVDGALLAHEERGGAGWVRAEATGIAPGVRVERCVVVMPDYVVDRVTLEADRVVTLDLPIHVDGELGGAAEWMDAPLGGGPDPEDGFEFLHDIQRATVVGAPRLVTERHGARFEAFPFADVPVEWWRATAPGPPGSAPRRMHLLRARGARATLTILWSPRGAVRDAIAVPDGGVAVTLHDGARHVHAPVGDGWHIDLEAGGARSSLDLGGARLAASPPPSSGERGAPPRILRIPRRRAIGDPSAVWFELERDHYRRSEQSWEEAGRPTAVVMLHATATHLEIEVEVPRSALCFVPAGAVNDMDNEQADINGDGVQLHLVVPEAGIAAAWTLVPEETGGVRRRMSRREGAVVPIESTWRREGAGYVLRAALPQSSLGRGPFYLDVAVNETVPGRQRRRGQLVLSGARGGWVYLRGDRSEPRRDLAFVLADG